MFGTIKYRGRILIQKLIIAQLGMKYIAFMDQKINCRVHKKRPSENILNQMQPDHNSAVS
jgi:hypothetical protein